MHYLLNITRSAGDPRVLRSGSSSRSGADELARALGWFSVGLGLAELLAPRRFTRALGISGSEMLVRGFGLREIVSGLLSLSPDKATGLWSRVGGDALDMLTLASAYDPDNPKRHNVGLALAAVAGITLLDFVGAQAVTSRHRRVAGDRQRYGDRSGFPQGVQRARGGARKDFRTPADMQAAPTAAGSPRGSKGAASTA